MILSENHKPGRPSGTKDMRLASAVVVIITGVILMLGLLGYYAIRRISVPSFDPSLQAIAYDAKYIQSHRRAYIFNDGTFIPVTHPPSHPGQAIAPVYTDPPPLPGDLPESWDIRDALWDDFTHDGIPEYALLVWRPWRDWPFIDESEQPSPIANAFDENGDSCHIVLIDPAPQELPSAGRTYRVIWAGSALPVPLTMIRAGDVDGDGKAELVALEGTYDAGRDAPAEHVTVWEWVEFGFTLQWRSSEVRVSELSLEDINMDDIADIVAY